MQEKRSFQYEKSQLIEVICQLKFPTILSIESRAPADFQEMIRSRFPRYMELEPPKRDGAAEPKSHCFISGDGRYKISLTRDFIALSTVGYSCWADFAAWLDEPLGHFIGVYKPAFFERIGLRYVNGISREKLGLTGTQWRELITPAYLGVLNFEDVDERRVSKCSVDADQQLDDKCRMHLHAGPGFVKRSVRAGNTIQTVQEQEVRFILDQDIFTAGNINIKDAVSTLDLIHSHACTQFSCAITDKLHQAMKPFYL